MTVQTPTAAAVTIGGRVVTADGRGIRNAVVTMTAPDGSIRTAATGAFGYFRFADVPAGGTYVFSVRSKRFTFSQPTQVLSLVGNVDDLNFVANE